MKVDKFDFDTFDKFVISKFDPYGAKDHTRFYIDKMDLLNGPKHNDQQQQFLTLSDDPYEQARKKR